MASAAAECANQHGVCGTLEQVLQTIFQNKMHWIETVFVEDVSVVSVNVRIEQDFNLQRELKLTVGCTDHCAIVGTFKLHSKQYVSQLIVVFENITFYDTSFEFFNLRVCFHSVKFVNSTMADVKHTWSSPSSELQLSFSDVSIDNRLHSFEIVDVSSVSLSITNCSFNGLHFVIKVLNLFVQIEQSTFFKSICSFLASIFLPAKIVSSHFISHTDSHLWSNNYALQFSSAKILFHMTNCTFQNTSGGLSLTKTKSGFLESWIQVEIDFCEFVGNERFAPGAAILIASDKLVGWSVNTVHISNSLFEGNKAKRGEYSNSRGAAISISTHSHNVFLSNALYNFISRCKFINNFAQDGGGAIFVDHYFIHLQVSDSYFLLNGSAFVSPKAVFLMSYAHFEIFLSTFVIKVHSNDKTLLELVTKTPGAKIDQIDVTINCLYWQRLDTQHQFKVLPQGFSELQSLSVSCSPCSSSFYFPADGIYHIVYVTNASDIIVTNDHSLVDTFKCLNCPYGADCFENELLAKPNFWGYQSDGEIKFQQCPNGYCCSGTQKSPCLNYNTCSGKRTGKLCGQCEKHHSISMLSDECIRNSNCRDSWIWAVGLSSSVLYMLWYTFKDNLLTFPVLLFSKIMSACKEKQATHVSQEIDKGYFGILTYFVQAKAMMSLTIQNQKTYRSANVISQIGSYITLFLNLEISHISTNACAFPGLDTTTKLLLKMLFLLGIYLSWAMVFAVVILVSILLNICTQKTRNQSETRDKFIKGYTEIVKYTYGSVTNILFMFLTCVFVDGQQVWFYDGSVDCYTNWQRVMGILTVMYVIPFPVMLCFGLKVLNTGKISAWQFLAGCLFPLPFLLIWAWKVSTKQKGNIINVTERTHTPIKTNTDKSVSTTTICESFQGMYKESDGWAQFWESIMILRRLLLAVIALFPNAMLQMNYCSILSVLFLVHHVTVKPFKSKASNDAETLSLTLLCVFSIFTVFKSAYIQMGLVSQGPDLLFFKVLNLLETLMIFLLLFWIIFLECFEKVKNFRSNRK